MNGLRPLNLSLKIPISPFLSTTLMTMAGHLVQFWSASRGVWAMTHACQLNMMTSQKHVLLPRVLILLFPFRNILCFEELSSWPIIKHNSGVSTLNILKH